MRQTSRPRGEPVLALVVLLGAWCSARAYILIHEDEGASGEQEYAVATHAAQPVRGPRAIAANTAHERNITNRAALTQSTSSITSARPDPTKAARLIEHDNNAQMSDPAPMATPSFTPLTRPAEPLPPPPVRIIAGHQALWMAALSQMPMPAVAAPSVVSPATPRPQSADKRWSADAWLMLRRGNGGLGAVSGLPSYGASQAGAVIRYRLSPGEAHRPTGYLRATTALDGSRQIEAALGLAARPLAKIPVIAAAELRLTSSGGSVRARPAALLITEIQPVRLPLAARAEIYGQAGYVGGRDATMFADGQLRIDRQVLRFKLGDLRAGGGIWAGAQKGASRVDIGPGVTVGATIGSNSSMRLSADWRFRITGRAVPTSGPALTLSAGF